MGIQGLLPILKDVQNPINVSQLKGQTLGIDGYVWLHRGAYGCAKALVKGESTTKYINYALHRIRMLQHHGITPYVVFDGDRLPSKAGTEEDREQKRAFNKAKAEELSMQGKDIAAFEYYAKCVDITPEMAYQLIKALKAQGVDYVVAPYEADAQLAYLERNGIIDAVVTEDSDLLVFGCKRVLFKMDAKGDCIEIQQSRLTACRSLSFVGWTTDLFRQMAILSGCDYLPSISGMGLKNAHRLLTRYKTVKKVLQVVRLEGKMRVPPDYARQFEQAEKTFLHQRVWDPREDRLTTLQPLGEDQSNEVPHYIGPDIEHDVAFAMARGEVDPITRLPIKDLVPDTRYRQQQTTSGALKRGPPAAQTSKGQQGLGSFFKKAPVARASSSGSNVLQALAGPSSLRPRLAPRDLNKASSAGDSGTAATPKKKSKYFGGASKGIGKAVSAEEPINAPPVLPTKESERGHAASPAAAVDDTAPLLQHPNSQSSPIAGIGDFFCELDGADADMLCADEPAEREEEPGMRSPSPVAPPPPNDDEIVMGVAATFSEDRCESGNERRVAWASEDHSDVSDADSTPSKKRKHMVDILSSPLSFDGDEHESRQGLAKCSNAVSVDDSKTGLTARGSSPDHINSSPSQDAVQVTAPVAGPNRARQSRSPSPGSPMAAAALRRKPASHKPQQSSRKSLSLVSGAPTLVKANEEDGFVPATDLARSLWAKYAHQDIEGGAQTPAAKAARPARAATTSRPTLGRFLTTGSAVQGASSCRPLRLYKSDEPASHLPFAPSSTADSPRAQREVRGGCQISAAGPALQFRSGPRHDPAQQADDATPTPMMKSSRSAPNIMTTSALKRKNMLSMTTDTTTVRPPLGARKSSNDARDAGTSSIKRHKAIGSGQGALRLSTSPQPPASSAFLDSFRFQKGGERGSVQG